MPDVPSTCSGILPCCEQCRPAVSRKENCIFLSLRETPRVPKLLWGILAFLGLRATSTCEKHTVPAALIHTRLNSKAYLGAGHQKMAF